MPSHHHPVTPPLSACAPLRPHPRRPSSGRHPPWTPVAHTSTKNQKSMLSASCTPAMHTELSRYRMRAPFVRVRFNTMYCAPASSRAPPNSRSMQVCEQSRKKRSERTKRAIRIQSKNTCFATGLSIELSPSRTLASRSLAHRASNRHDTKVHTIPASGSRSVCRRSLMDKAPPS